MATDQEIQDKLAALIFRKTETTKTILKQAAQLITDPEWDTMSAAIDDNDAQAVYDIIKLRRDEKVQADADAEATAMWADSLLNKTEIERVLFDG